MQRASHTASRLALLVVLSAATLLAACGSSGEATGATCPADSTLTYENFGQAFVLTNCLSCHTSREQPMLTTLTAIQAHLDEIDQAAAAGPNAVNTSMPDGASVSTAERTKLGEWLACGAP